MLGICFRDSGRFVCLACLGVFDVVCGGFS